MNTKKLFSGLGWGYIIFMLLTLVFQLIFMRPFAFLKKEMSTDFLMLISEIAMYGCAFPVFYLWIRRFSKWGMEKKKTLPMGTFFLWLLFSFGMSYLGNIIGQILMYAVTVVTGTPIENPVNIMIQELNIGSLFFYVVIIAPLMEELIFRKLLIDRIIPYGQKAAVIISGIAFGLFHGNFYQFFYACFLGMIFAYIYTKTGTMWYGVAIHAIINFAGGIVSAFALTQLKEGSPVAMLVLMLYGILMIVSILAAIVLLCIFAPKTSFFPGWSEEAGKGLWKKMLFTPGVLLYVIMCIIMFI